MTDIVGVGGLAEDIGVSFGLPILFMSLALVNITISSRRRYAGLKLRLSLIFSIALFTYLILSLLFQDRLVLSAIWHSGPVLYSFVYSVAGVSVLVGVVGLAYWKLRPELWRGGDEDDPSDEVR